MATESQYVYSSESPEIAARKLGLIDLVKELTSQPVEGGLPAFQVAGQTGLQTQAYDLARTGVGAFAPYISTAAQRVGGGIDQLGQAAGQYGAGAGLVDTALAGYAPIQEGALTGVGRAAELGQAASGAGVLGIGQQLAGMQPYLQDAALGLGMGATAGEQAYADTLAQLQGATTGARGQAQAAQTNLGTISGGALGRVPGAQTDIDIAAQRARQSTAGAQQALQQAGQFGMGAAQQGIGALAGTAGQFDPTTATRYFNPYEDAVVQQALADVQRASDIAGQGERAQAVAAGAFGGARSGIVASERARNALEQQARTAAQLRQAGFQSAQEQAQNAFEAAQRRAQQAAQLTGALGAQGAGTALQAASQAGQLGLSAEQLAQRGAVEGTQLGLSADQLAGQLAGEAGRMGMSAEQLAGQLAQTGGALGMQSAGLRADTASQLGQLGARYGQIGIGGEEAAARLGLAGADITGQMAGLANQIGTQGAQLGLSGAGTLRDIGSGYGALGQAYGALGTQTAALGELGQTMQIKDMDYLSKLGSQQQQFEQAKLDAARQSALQTIYGPYQRAGFYSDILRGAPSSQSVITQTSSPNPSLLSQLTGAAATGLGLAGAASKSGII